MFDIDLFAVTYPLNIAAKVRCSMALPVVHADDAGMSSFANLKKNSVRILISLVHARCSCYRRYF